MDWQQATMLSKPHRVAEVGFQHRQVLSKTNTSRRAGIQLVPDLWLQTGQHTQHARENVPAVSRPAPVAHSPHITKLHHMSHVPQRTQSDWVMHCRLNVARQAANAWHHLAFHTLNFMKASLGQQGQTSC
jgi:hypothetical protein